jgi:hypothetical protein
MHHGNHRDGVCEDDVIHDVRKPSERRLADVIDGERMVLRIHFNLLEPGMDRLDELGAEARPPLLIIERFLQIDKGGITKIQRTLQLARSAERAKCTSPRRARIGVSSQFGPATP